MMWGFLVSLLAMYCVSCDKDVKVWCLDTCGFIRKKIHWHIHAGPWSLVN